MVNNAGTGGTESAGKVHEMKDETWDFVMQVIVLTPKFSTPYPPLIAQTADMSTSQEHQQPQRLPRLQARRRAVPQTGATPQQASRVDYQHRKHARGGRPEARCL